MTLPGPEDGHLRMPNWLVERLARLRLNGTQWQILWAVWRRTLCWQEKGHWGNRPWPISTGDIAAAIDINQHQVKREMSQLVAWNIILRDNSPGGRGHKPLTAFNLDPSSWKVPLKSSKDDTLNERVAIEPPFASENGSETVTPTSEEFEKKGSGNATPSVADSLPFTDKSATLSQAKSRLPKETLNKHYKQTYIVVFDHWNSLEIIKHKKMTDRMRGTLKSALKNYTKEEICQAMSTYAEILHGGDYYWQYRWTLDEFLRRGLEKFMDAKVARENYSIQGQPPRQSGHRDQPGPKGKPFEQWKKEQEQEGA